MTSLGRFFDFRQSPIPQHRLGRFKTGVNPIVQGAPVTVPGATEERDTIDGRLAVALAGKATAPKIGLSGLLVWEAPWTAFWGMDPVTTRSSDIDICPAFTPAQVVHGTEVRFVIYNIAATDGTDGFQAYHGRNMMKPAEMTSGLDVGDLLTPGLGNGEAGGFWELTADATLAWARVTGVDLSIGEVEAQLLF